ncbi:cell division protein ZapE [Celerinatantimonas sp. YJH-8]|uniref:cell division protein ZapE n=1 Tax=Celerinatantimonas sp. YJH-8 TaxID=3228714 RepID=UPI0038C713FE
MTPLQCYQQDLSADRIVADSAQAIAVNALERVYQQCLEHSAAVPSTSPQWHFWKKRDAAVMAPLYGLYLWGGVGRGKTYLMDLLVSCLPTEQVTRLHFYHFMQQIHHRLTQLQGTVNPLQHIAREFAKQTRLICFDEFFVIDITDAMLLGTLFEALFAEGVGLVATSNIPPHDLYHNGLQRSRFLPAIALIEKHCQIINVDGKRDYRQQASDLKERYYWPVNESNRAMLLRWFERLTAGAEPSRQSLALNAHFVEVEGCVGDVLYIHFNQLCRSARSSQDYIELAQRFKVVIIEHMPCLTDDDNDAARRLLMLIDECYEQHVALIIMAEQDPMHIYQGKRLAFDFERCSSRLQQLRSQQYCPLP